MKRVFIGGMGRSGTTIALNALYQHGELAAVPIETKFLVEVDGFADLLEAVTVNFSTAITPEVVRRFEFLMRKKVTGLMASEFTQQHDLSSSIFPHYQGAVDIMIEMVLHRSFYSTREPILMAMRQFVAYTFDHLATTAGKVGWVEKTPANFWRVEFLRELFPGSYFVHLIRDPRMIMCSLLQKGWLPQDLKKAVVQFESMLSALVIERRKLLKKPRIIEIKLEHLESDMTIHSALSCLAKELDLAPYTSHQIDGVKNTIGNYNETRQSRVSFTEEDGWIINQALLPWIVELGYTPVFPGELLKTL